ncbi:phage minor head protein [Burkholderia multivorans]|uniref:phage minor head protein n=1 Tax=Burkholderia multivorans TaxID=87883 RepID=UPI0020B2E779|nr:phage minor head protein [Burkholderia multivorans]
MAAWKSTLTAIMRQFADSARSTNDLALAVTKLRELLQQSPQDKEEIQKRVRKTLTDIHDRELKKQPPSPTNTFTRARVAQSAQKLLDEKIVQSLSLIELNRTKSVETTVQRFVGWASSLPPKLTVDHPRQVIEKVEKGFRIVEKSPIEIKREEERLREAGINRKVKTHKRITTYTTRYVQAPPGPEKTESYAMRKLRADRDNISKAAEKALARYEAQRVTQDQAHKLAAGIAETIAVNNQALGFAWEAHWSKHPREDHQKRDGIVYLYRDSPIIRLAHSKGWIRNSSIEYVEDLPEIPGQEINCRCTASYIYSLSALYRKAPQIFTPKYVDARAQIT